METADRVGSPGRSLASYLVLPRSGETYGKGWLAPLGYGLVLLAGHTDDGVAFPLALLAWVVFELGLLQARYMVNDLADADVDRLHVAARARGRLPDVPGARRWAVRVVAARLLLTAAVIVLLPGRAGTILGVAAAGLVGATVAYEAARTAIRRHPVVPGQVRLSAREAAVFATVGAGYAIRVGLGAALAGADGPALAATAVFGWAFGTLVVFMTWTLEAAGLVAGGDTAVLARKSHVAVLARLVGGDRPRLAKPLLGGAPGRLTLLLFAVASALAVLVGVTLGESPGALGLAALLVACALVSPAVMAWWTSDWGGRAAMAVDVAAALTLSRGGVGAVVALLFVVSGVVASMRSFTPDAMKLNPTEPAPATESAGSPARP